LLEAIAVKARWVRRMFDLDHQTRIGELASAPPQLGKQTTTETKLAAWFRQQGLAGDRGSARCGPKPKVAVFNA
jgi:hypothetical protein